MQDVPRIYIRTHIEELKAYVLQEYPLAVSLHGVRNELVPAMVSLLLKLTEMNDPNDGIHVDPDISQMDIIILNN